MSPERHIYGTTHLAHVNIYISRCFPTHPDSSTSYRTTLLRQLCPRPLILVRALDGNTQLACGVQRPVRVAQQLTCEEDDVGLAFLQDRLRLRGARNEANSGNRDLGDGLDRSSKWDL